MNGHDTDPTPPHGTERPTRPDLRHALDLLNTGAVWAAEEIREAVDTLALAVRLSHSGHLDILAHVLADSGRDWFGWFRCPSCHAETAPDDRGESGYCLDCDAGLDDLSQPCAACAESGRLLDSEGVCLDCLHDDQDRDAYGAPYGGRDDLDD